VNKKSSNGTHISRFPPKNGKPQKISHFARFLFDLWPNSCFSLQIAGINWYNKSKARKECFDRQGRPGWRIEGMKYLTRQGGGQFLCLHLLSNCYFPAKTLPVHNLKFIDDTHNLCRHNISIINFWKGRTMKRGIISIWLWCWWMQKIFKIQRTVFSFCASE